MKRVVLVAVVLVGSIGLQNANGAPECPAPPSHSAGSQALSEGSSVTVRLRLFIDDVEEQVSHNDQLKIRSGDQPVELSWLAEDRVSLHGVREPWSIVFSRGDLAAGFDGLPPALLAGGGELLIAFFTKPDRLLADVHLARGDSGPIDKYFGYDDTRNDAAHLWRASSANERRLTRTVIFFRFKPDVDGVQTAISGLYFVPKGAPYPAPPN